MQVEANHKRQGSRPVGGLCCFSSLHICRGGLAHLPEPRTPF